MFINFCNASKENIFDICKKNNIRFAGILLYKIRIDKDDPKINAYIPEMLKDSYGDLSQRTASFAFFSFVDFEIDFSKVFMNGFVKQYYQESNAEKLDLIMEWLGVVFGVGGKYPSFIILDIESKNYRIYDLTKYTKFDDIFMLICDLYEKLFEVSSSNESNSIMKLSGKKLKKEFNTDVKCNQDFVLNEILKKSGISKKELAIRLNRKATAISRYFGSIPETSLIGKRELVLKICIACGGLTLSDVNWTLKALKCFELDLDEDSEIINKLNKDEVLD